MLELQRGNEEGVEEERLWGIQRATGLPFAVRDFPSIVWKRQKLQSDARGSAHDSPCFGHADAAVVPPRYLNTTIWLQSVSSAMIAAAKQPWSSTLNELTDREKDCPCLYPNNFSNLPALPTMPTRASAREASTANFHPSTESTCSLYIALEIRMMSSSWQALLVTVSQRQEVRRWLRSTAPAEGMSWKMSNPLPGTIELSLSRV
eukprot:757343-Hanusia_phi.AAC.2